MTSQTDQQRAAELAEQVLKHAKEHPILRPGDLIAALLLPLVRDAERYRWLRELPNADALNVRYMGTDLDCVIDQARSAT